MCHHNMYACNHPQFLLKEMFSVSRSKCFILKFANVTIDSEKTTFKEMEMPEIEML